MAGDWLKIETVTPDKPEVLEMANELNLDPDAVFGKLFRVWTWFDSHSEDGNAPSVTQMLLDRQVGVTGFVTAMVNVKWMIKNENGLSIPNFDTHNGATAKKRANTARRVAKSRKGNANDNASSNDDVTPEALQKALAREEKRREEEKTIVEQAQQCIGYLNELAGTNFKFIDTNIDFVKSRIDQGYSIDDILAVIKSKCDEWKGTENAKYLRPSTIFRKEKFSQYHGQVGIECPAPKTDISKLNNEELLKMAQDLSISTQGLFRPDLISAIQGKIQ